MRFIDRVNEQERLHKALGASPKGSKGSKRCCFIVIYGRLRLGKSSLIKRVLSKNDVYYEAEKNEAAIQRSLLVNAIRAVYPQFGGARYDSWESLLLNFNQVCIKGTTLALDEFPYLVQKNPALTSALQRLIDSNILKFNLIICGSSQRMMQKIILNSSEPLYGRADEKINLSPIGIKNWEKESRLKAINVIEEFSVWGGVPRYWMLREKYDSFEAAIDGLVLDEHGILFDEPAALFMDEISEIAPYPSIMTAIGNGNNKFSKIADTVGKKTTELSVPLRNLLEMKYIGKDVPFGESENKTKKTLYQIADPFMSFYFRFIAPNKSLLSLGRTKTVKETIRKQMPEHVSHIWEQLCRISVSGNDMFGNTWGQARRWWSKDLEFDVVAESMDKKSILVGECKWNSADYAGRLLEKLKAKAEKAPFIKGKKVVYALFLKEKPLDKTDANVVLPEAVIENQP